MNAISEIFRELTSTDRVAFKHSIVDDFAIQMGWKPSYFLQSKTDYFSNGHLIVEHGLENTAVLSFLNKSYFELTLEERKKLLNISYNNLVDWHISIDRQDVSFLYNRSQSHSVIETNRIDQAEFQSLRSDAFQRVIGKKPSPNIPPLDDALISTIANWKTELSASLDNSVSNAELSALFNTIIFIRAIEDNKKRHSQLGNSSKILIKALDSNGKFSTVLLFKHALDLLDTPNVPEYLIDFNKLKIFEKLSSKEIGYLIEDFYEIRDSIYSYDFSIMSKHALSRIYERYVSILKIEDKENSLPELFPKKPVEKINKAFGAYYTPQFLARFFVKFLRNESTLSQFQSLKIAEPAVGSGIFLRTFLEIQQENTDTIRNNNEAAFQNLLGIDIDENACHSTKLSIALLHLLLYDKFPAQLNIIQSNSIDYFLKHPELLNSFDSVISNPPFVRLDEQQLTEREKIKEFMVGFASGRIDQYLVFLKIAVEYLKPGGIGLFVLPHSFTLSDYSAKARAILKEKCEILFLADLSAVSIFENAQAYISLLIFQKKNQEAEKKAILLKCRNSVGQALENVLNGNFVSNRNFDLYQVEQSFFNSAQWTILSEQEINLNKKIEGFKKLSEFLDVRQGIITGKDEVFIRNLRNIARSEKSIYLEYVPDKEIEEYADFESSRKCIFYPFDGQTKITERFLRDHFPQTWDYLKSRKGALQDRKANTKEWWMPHSLGRPSDLRSPKIITPHLTLTPKFALNLNGNITVSHSPFLKLKEGYSNYDLLYYFLGVLNSSPTFWYISAHSHKYGRSYSMLEPKTLKNTPVPDPFDINRNELIKFIKIVKKRVHFESEDEKKIGLEKEIDLMASDFYNLTEAERSSLMIN